MDRNSVRQTRYFAWLYLRSMQTFKYYNNMLNYSAPSRFIYIWNKYRPAILKLMVDSSDGPQQYRFAHHEFRKLNLKEKKGCTFTLRVFRSKAVNSIRDCEIAHDLLMVLQQSRTSMTLTEQCPYEFTLNDRFVLHVVKCENESTISYSD